MLVCILHKAIHYETDTIYCGVNGNLNKLVYSLKTPGNYLRVGFLDKD
jgi:hypothetical protein